MVFTSLHFVAFFVVVYALYRVLPHRAQNVMLLGASYYFYGSWDWRFLSLLIGSTVVDYLVSRYLGREVDPRKRKVALVLSLVFNLGMLASSSISSSSRTALWRLAPSSDGRSIR
jgi:D-alanyl-lipoteichoic acid acyltransferase DltB (MBOAT superfamily)